MHVRVKSVFRRLFLNVEHALSLLFSPAMHCLGEIAWDGQTDDRTFGFYIC
jgi:hypothetical protein